MIFKGPLFIVGYGRSGTKLLRSLLNGHSHIAIPDIETNFLPKWISEWESYGDLEEFHNFKKFYLIARREPFFYYQRERGNVINVKDWYKSCLSFDTGSVYEALVKHYLPTTAIWGDKSPNHSRHMSAIKRTFPDAKFVHIVRDVRDCCLSAKRAWKTNFYRCAQRWQDTLQDISKQICHLGKGNIIEIRYEDLLENTDATLRKICRFLELDFEKSMLELENSPERIGDAAGKNTVIRGNRNKYLKQLNLRQIEKLERIAVTGLKRYGYPYAYNGNPIRVPQMAMLLYKLKDGFNHLVRNYKDKGLAEGFRFTYQFFTYNRKFNR
jgi:hypothetical protein